MTRDATASELLIPKRHEPRIAFFDIETAPLKAYAWEKYETNLIEIISGGYMLCFAVKWLGKEKIEVYGLPDFPGYKKNKEDDLLLVTKLWEIMNEADVIVAHNGDSFDIKTSNKRMSVNGLPPPAPYKTIDTLKIARQSFKFPSNKLDDLGIEFKIGRKLPHTGFHLWKGCMEGDPKSWDLMKRYNKQDVVLLEKVYLKVRPWAKTYPNLNVYNQSFKCPRCGSNRIQKRGNLYTNTYKYQRYHCTECRGWFRGENLTREEARA